MKKRSVEDTRLALLRAAEQLFADKGVDAVSLREVSAAAGQANNSAVSYHFGNREQLIDAILDRHSAHIQNRYVAQLEALERHGQITLRALVEILTLPIIAKLDDADGGWAYLSICAQLSVNPLMPLASRPVAQTPQVIQLMMATTAFLGAAPDNALFRLERVANMIYASAVQWHRLVQTGVAHVAREVFEQDLVDTLVSVIELPSSPSTLAAIARGAPPPAPAPARRRRR